MSINLHIERLVLDGLSLETQQQFELKASLRLALSQQLVSTGLSQAITLNHSLRANPSKTIAINSDAESSSIGRKIGNAVYRSIGE